VTSAAARIQAPTHEIRGVRATRYVTAFREGGSLPGLVEADDDGLYVVKFRGAGQGPRVLVAEWLAGEVARALGLLVPELVAVDLAAWIADSEPDPGGEKAPGSAEQDDAGVQALAPLDPRDDPDDRVLEGLVPHVRPPWTGRGRPPRRTAEATPAGATGSGGRHPVGPRRHRSSRPGRASRREWPGSETSASRR